MDLVIDEGEGRYRVVDIKTAAATYGPDRLEFDHQPTVYIAATEHLFNAKGKVSFEYWLLLKTKKPQFKILPVVRNADDRHELIQTIQEVHQATNANVHPRIRSNICTTCEYRRACQTERSSSCGDS
jgi:CRISPR/Cas system-associated exonuclease Cas4 (RecB family)